MSVLIENGAVVADRWAAVADDAPLPDAPAIVSLARALAEPDLVGRDQGLGIVVEASADLAAILPLLSRVGIVVVHFAAFRDGRGFTLGRLLRERHGFAGVLRAAGHVLPDQYEFLVRCGFTQVAVGDEAELAEWTSARGRFHVAYQPSALPERGLGGLRRRLT